MVDLVDCGSCRTDGCVAGKCRNAVKGVQMDRQEADLYMRFIDKRRKALTLAAQAVNRKRGWTESQKMMARGELLREQDIWASLHKKLGEAFNLGGY